MNKVAKVMRVSFMVNTLLSTFKILIGFIGNSGALVADGLHSISDLITDVIVIVSSKFSMKPADKDHPFGHGRIDYIISIVISAVIIMIGTTVIMESFSQSFVIPSKIVAIVSLITIMVKMYLSNYIIKRGRKYKSNVLISSGFESRTDVITSIVVLISSLLMMLSEKIDILKYSNFVAMLIVGLFIIKTGVDLLKENLSVLIGSVEEDEDYLNIIRKIISEDKNVLNIDVITLMKYGMYYHLICEISMEPTLPLVEAHNIAENIENKIKKKEKQVEFITIHLNPYTKKDD